MEQKKFQNKSKNIDKVYRLVSFRCIMPLLYRVTFLCNVVCKLIIHQKALYDIFYEKVVKWCDIKWNQKNSKKYIFILHEYDTIGCEH